MILELALLDVRPGEENAFEAAFAQAQSIIASMQGYVSHELQRCVENPSRYVLLVRWQTLSDHTEGLEVLANIRSGSDCSTISTTLSLPSSTLNRLMVPTAYGRSPPRPRGLVLRRVDQGKFPLVLQHVANLQ